MSIQACVIEIKAIQLELKSLNEQRKKLKNREKQLENEIKNFLKQKEQHGIKHQDTVIILEEKECKSSKGAKERENDSIRVLEKYGIRDPNGLLKELNEARHGPKVVKEKLKISKLNKQK
jgi:indole-3-glycerol phosphate synthase